MRRFHVCSGFDVLLLRIEQQRQRTTCRSRSTMRLLHFRVRTLLVFIALIAGVLGIARAWDYPTEMDRRTEIFQRLAGLATVKGHEGISSSARGRGSRTLEPGQVFRRRRECLS